MIEPRAHIQHTGEGETYTKHYWAYPNRLLPCTSDSGTCEYLDAVYWMHETSMLYTFILWAVLGGCLTFLLWLRYAKSISRRSDIETPLKRGLGAIGAFGRRWLLFESPGRWFFGRVTMLQVAILLTLSAYLLIFSLVGIVYKTWITPVKKSPGLYNTRTGMGGFGDRVGAMAYALTPFTVALSTRESVLSLITGIPYQHFNFLHRWTGRIIFIQSFLHTLVWTIVEGKLYQPQPSVYAGFIKEQYILFGVVAQVFITFLYVFSTSWAIRWTGYEFFKRTHYVIALLYLGACWGHWAGLACWMIASIILLALDKGIRVLRTALLHTGYRKGISGLGFTPATATLQHFGSSSTDSSDGEVIRVDFDHRHAAWKPGQHFYLCFPAISMWQSHPFTPSSLPDGKSGVQHHTYLVRVRSGITAQLSALAKESNDGTNETNKATTSVILCGPYGGTDSHAETTSQNLLAVAGGTGVTSVLPILQDALSSAQESSISKVRELVWVIRHLRDLKWIEKEVIELKEAIKEGRARGLRVRVFVTREASLADSACSDDESSTSCASSSSSSAIEGVETEKVKSCCGGGGGGGGSKTADPEKEGLKLSEAVTLLSSLPGFEITFLDHKHPDLELLVSDFEERVEVGGGGGVRIVGAGPAEIGTVLRSAVAKRNFGAKVWKGDAGGGWGLEWDCRS